jgi:prevent-host-death family protein
MSATITATEAKNRFGEVIRRVYRDGETLIVERSGLPVVAIVPVQEYRSRMTRQIRFARAVRTAAQEAESLGLTEYEVQEQVQEIREEAHQERYGE